MHGSWNVKLGIPNVSWPGQRKPRLGLELVIKSRVAIGPMAMAKGGPHSISLPKGEQFRMA